MRIPKLLEALVCSVGDEDVCGDAAGKYGEAQLRFSLLLSLEVMFPERSLWNEVSFPCSEEAAKLLVLACPAAWI